MLIIAATLYYKRQLQRILHFKLHGSKSKMSTVDNIVLVLRKSTIMSNIMFFLYPFQVHSHTGIVKIIINKYSTVDIAYSYIVYKDILPDIGSNKVLQTSR